MINWIFSSVKQREPKFMTPWGDEVSLHKNSHSHSRSLRDFEVKVRGFKIFEAFLRLRVM